MSFMLEEIHAQPEAIARLLEREADAVTALAQACRDRPVEMLFIAARGTSDHAAVYAKYLCEIVSGMPVCLAAPSVFTLYEAELRLQNALVLGISQSGAAADARQILEVSRRAGRLTACITNNENSPMASVAEHVINCSAGEERSLPATKTYTTSLAAVAALVAEYGQDDDLCDDLARVPEWLAAVLEREDEIADRVERYRYMEQCVILGRGYNQCTALETALKLAETSYVRAQAYSAADFLHGPIAVVEEGSPCLLYAPGGRAYADMLSLAERLQAQGAELLVVSDRDEILDMATTPLPAPPVPEPLTPIVHICVGQLFAYHLARVKGRDPDRPRGLKKVTVTR